MGHLDRYVGVAHILLFASPLTTSLMVVHIYFNTHVYALYLDTTKGPAQQAIRYVFPFEIAWLR